MHLLWLQIVLCISSGAHVSLAVPPLLLPTWRVQQRHQKVQHTKQNLQMCTLAIQELHISICLWLKAEEAELW